MPFVYSTATCSTDYIVYHENCKDISRVKHKITIKGGANNSTKLLVTPRGVRTEVSDEDLKLLQQDYHFQQAVKHGFHVVDDIRANANKVAANMNAKDGSAPKTPDDPEFRDKVMDGKKSRK